MSNDGGDDVKVDMRDEGGDGLKVFGGRVYRRHDWPQKKLIARIRQVIARTASQKVHTAQIQSDYRVYEMLLGYRGDGGGT